LTKKLNVTSLVVTHEMDSAFTLADRMCMLDKGKILKMGTKHDFELLRDGTGELKSEQERLVRQFLRGDAEGPITERQLASDYEEDLFMARKSY
jgi:phospholipid/cholesterol/gamma-HCH transport system ATP-binding protein